MKRTLFLAAALIFAAIAIVAAAIPERKAEVPLAERMRGVWAMQPGDVPKDGRGLKFIMDNRWCVAGSDTITGKVSGAIGGRYSLEGDTYTETVEYSANPDIVGKKLTFKLKVEGDSFTQTGIDNPYTTTLKRPKD
jgi:hypothetical protein